MLELVVYGIVLGSIIALGSIGLTLVWGITDLFNCAHGDQMTVGAYLALLFGSLFAFNTGELFASYFGSFRFALLAAVGACALSLLGNVFYILMDRKAEKTLRLRDESAAEKIVFKDIQAFRLRKAVLIW